MVLGGENKQREDDKEFWRDTLSSFRQMKREDKIFCPFNVI